MRHCIVTFTIGSKYYRLNIKALNRYDAMRIINYRYRRPKNISVVFYKPCQGVSI